jgi:hypothetical protein
MSDGMGAVQKTVKDADALYRELLAKAGVKDGVKESDGDGVATEQPRSSYSGRNNENSGENNENSCTHINENSCTVHNETSCTHCTQTPYAERTAFVSYTMAMNRFYATKYGYQYVFEPDLLLPGRDPAWGKVISLATHVRNFDFVL